MSLWEFSIFRFVHRKPKAKILLSVQNGSYLPEINSCSFMPKNIPRIHWSGCLHCRDEEPEEADEDPDWEYALGDAANYNHTDVRNRLEKP